MALLYDVSHSTCKEERHALDRHSRRLFVHRKGATRAFSLGRAEQAPLAYKDVGAVREAAKQAGLIRRVAPLRPRVCIKD